VGVGELGIWARQSDMNKRYLVKKWNLVVDVATCENCNNCTLATRDEFVGNEYPGYTASQPQHGHQWMKIDRKVRGGGSMVDAAYRVTTCNQCDNAPCIKAAGNDGSMYKRDDGIVMIDPDKAKGRKDLVDACPYGAIWWNEEHELPQNWIFDAHLLDQGWTKPRCVQSCPTGSLQVLKVEDSKMKEIAERDNLQVLRPDLDTKPRVYYQNLDRFTKCFIGGTVLAEIDGVLECINSAQVTLVREGHTLESMETDEFGDFKFDQLESKNDEYELKVSHQEFGSTSAKVELDGDSLYVGSLIIQ
jgi:Fe-S-cluster-containing dehydrogenase component